MLPSIFHAKDESEMVLVNAGRYPNVPTSVIPDSDSRQYITLSAFYIDRHEITVKQYRQFDPGYNEKSFTENKECPNCPAMGIDLENANRYCTWADKRLPTETEWVAAARGPEKNVWPWGNRFVEDYANLLGNIDGFDGPAPVASFPPGSSVYGAMDMIGNVWEWVSDSLPFTNESSSQSHILKGGGWRSVREEATIDFQNHVPFRLKNPTFGFRCVKPQPQKI